ncbi:MAG: hypothetical protein ACI9FB_001774 [Candidatus Azotimanducaceae bacterium]|jgi:hypothetical protein
MKSAKPILQLTAYYSIIAVFIYGLTDVFPGFTPYLPFGGNEITSSGVGEFMTGDLRAISWDPLQKAIHLALALVGVVLVMEPVSWVYMGARRKKGRDQAFMLTLILLPVVVAGIVLIVQNSLALAFSLAGIVAGVRFRLTLDDSLDASFIFVAIFVGLAAGIEALEIAIVVTAFFSYFVLIFWELDYGEEVSSKRWFTRRWMQENNEAGEKESRDK